MVKSDLVRILQQNYPELSLEQAEKAIDIFFGQLRQGMILGYSTQIRGLGNFATRELGPTKARNPKTGEQITLTRRKAVSFRPSTILIAMINKP